MRTNTTIRRRQAAAPPSGGSAAAARRSTGTPAPDPQIARLARNIRRLAAEHDLTLAALGRRIGMRNGNALYNLMNGWSGTLSLPTLLRLCDVFGVTLDALTGRHPAPPPVPAARIAAAVAEAEAALATARAAIDTAGRALQAAAALLPAGHAGG